MAIKWLNLKSQKKGARTSAFSETGASLSITKARSHYSEKSKVTYHYPTCVRVRLRTEEADDIGWQSGDRVKIGYDSDENIFAIQKCENGDRVINSYQVGVGDKKRTVGILVYWYPGEGQPFYQFRRKIPNRSVKWNHSNDTLTIPLPSSILPQE